MILKNQFSSLAEIDREIINLIHHRCQYVENIHKREKNKIDSVKKFQETLEQRKDWALSAGLHPNLVNKISQYLIDYYITEVSR